MQTLASSRFQDTKVRERAKCVDLFRRITHLNKSPAVSLFSNFTGLRRQIEIRSTQDQAKQEIKEEYETRNLSCSG